MSAADELRAATTRLEELAAPVVHAAPWVARNEDPDIDHGWTLSTPKPDGPRGVSWYVADDLPEETARWAAALGPQVTAPLVALLSAAAEAAEGYPGLEDPLSHVSRISAYPDQAGAYRHTADLIRAGLDLARLINGGAPDA